MPGFLETAACKGHRPECLATHRQFSRPDLIAKLLRERHVARFLVAPDGFGKSLLACEYAETVFSFEHVFWINGKSPCFLRDLDEGSLAGRLAELDPAPFLAVFEDIPRLDAERAACFSRVIDELLDEGKEVLVTCVPTNDAYAERHRDRTKLDATSLLLTEAECMLASAEGAMRRSLSATCPAERIACLWWGEDDGSQLLAGVAREEMPSDLALAFFAMLTLQEGSRTDLNAFLHAGADEDVVNLLEGSYPLLGIDRHGEHYRAARLPMRAIAAAFDASFDALAARSLFDGRDMLARKLADALVARSKGARACKLMQAVASKAACASWLFGQSRPLLKTACLKPAHDLYAYVGHAKGTERLSLGVAEAWRLATLGDEAQACRLARRAAFADGAPLDDRAFALFVVMSHATAGTRSKARDIMRGLVQVQEAELLAAPDRRHGGVSAKAPSWMALAPIALALETGFPSGVDAWIAACKDGADADVLTIGATLVLSAAEGANGSNGGETEAACAADWEDGCKRSLADIAQYVQEKLDDAEEEPLDLFTALAACELDKACARGAVVQAPPLSPQGMLAAHQMERLVLEQQAAYRQDAQKQQERRDDYFATHPDAFRDDRRLRKSNTASLSGAPLLRVNLFGGFEVWVGDEPIDPQLSRRQKAQTLSPESKLESARKNLYSVRSKLHHTLETPAGTCPYLIRSQSGCKIDARLLDSDVTRFNALCRTLLSSNVSPEAWESLFSQLSFEFSGDLLPGESACGLIVRMREEYRVRLVDALVAASAKLAAAGEIRGSLWFAREALKRDASREDVYTTLMEAQIAAGQRTAALETYFACRRYLADELGIDPSVRTVKLYRDIIEAEEALDW